MKLPGWVSNLAPFARKRQAVRESVSQLLDQARRERAAGASEAALDHFLEVLRLQPDCFEAAFELAFGWSASGDADQAEHFSRLALDINPASAVLHLHLGALLFDSGRYEEAVRHNREAVALEPRSAQARNNLANSLKQAGKASEALIQYRKAIELEPHLAEGHFNLGAALLEMRELDAAERHMRLALQASPDFAEANFGLAHLLGEKGEAHAAIAQYRRVMELQPQLAQAHFNAALQLLLIGEYEEGWREYEWRLRLPEVADLWPRFSCPFWTGSNRPGESVLLYAEQGFGDAIQMIRFAPFVAARGARVLVRCRRELKRLFECMPEADSVTGPDDPLPETDFVYPLLSLPHMLQTGLGDLPARVPYLDVPGAETRLWKERLAVAGKGGMKIGLAWSSDPHNRVASLKSVSLGALAALFQVPGATFYSLQKGRTNRDSPPAGARIVDFTSELDDFADTAALISSLDLVISIDTAVAHLAGALGKPVWTLIHYPPDWRWLTDRTDSPWYPTMRLFRQAPGASWGRIIEQVADALAVLSLAKGDAFRHPDDQN